MKTKKIFLPLLFCVLTSMAVQGCGNSNKSSLSGPTLNLAGGKQGQSVGFADVDGDGIPDKIVGAPYATTTWINTGAVLVYKGTDMGFSATPEAILTGDDNLGYSFVKIGNDFAVSAIHGNGDDVSLGGSVTIYQGGGNGRIIKKLSGELPMDKFGYAIASGDLNGDEIPDLAVGATFNTYDPNYYQGGAVYVFFGPDFTTSVALHASSTNSGLGWAVATGDVNNDGTDDLLISASGKVLVFYGNNPIFSPNINAPSVTFKSAASGFGKAIAVIGDVIGDGKGEIAIGAPNAVISLNTVTSRDVGSVYVVNVNGASPINLDTAPTGTTGPLITRLDGKTFFSRFGSSVTVLGDVDGGGKPDFAVGAPIQDINWNILSGTVYVFKGEDIAAGTPWANTSATDGMVKNQAYGTSLAAATLMTGPTGTECPLIGAPRSNADKAGLPWLILQRASPWRNGRSGGSTGGGGGECH
jgi:hypothetical protein